MKDDCRHQRDENSIFACIWRTPEYAERIDFAFSVLTDMPFFVSDSVFVMLFATGKNDPFEARKKNWILNKMLESVGNVSLVSILLDAVMVVFPDWKEEVLANYLKYDQDIEHFKQLNLLPTSESWSGSEIPVINRRITELESIRDSLIGPEYIEHKVYLEELIRSKEQYRDKVRKREYLEDNMVF